MFEGARTEADLCFRKLVPEEAARARLFAGAVGGAGGRAWAGARGFVHAHVEAHAFPVDKTEFYFAGPPPMVEAMNELLVMRWRAPLGANSYGQVLLKRVTAGTSSEHALLRRASGGPR